MALYFSCYLEHVRIITCSASACSLAECATLMCMKRFFIFSFLTLFACVPAQAQKNKIRILYSQNVPAIVRREVPASGITKFFGVWKSESTKRDILIHFYSAPTKEEPLLCKVDVFERLRSIKGNSLRRINSAQLNENPELFSYVTNNVPNTVVTLTYGADVIWANQKEKKIPVLRFHVLSSGGLHGQYDDYILISFAQGWNNKAKVQYYESRGDTNEFSWVTFDKVDERGFMVVTTWHDVAGEGTGNPTKVEHYWNGETFAAKDDKK